jgi:hypothetical protein
VTKVLIGDKKIYLNIKNWRSKSYIPGNMNSGIQTALSSGRRVSLRNPSLELDKLEVSPAFFH